MVDHKTEEVWRHLENIVNTGQTPSDREMVLDPRTGEFVVVERGKPKPEDGVVVDPSAEDGFW